MTSSPFNFQRRTLFRTGKGNTHQKVTILELLSSTDETIRSMPNCFLKMTIGLTVDLPVKIGQVLVTGIGDKQVLMITASERKY